MHACDRHWKVQDFLVILAGYFHHCWGVPMVEVGECPSEQTAGIVQSNLLPLGEMTVNLQRHIPLLKSHQK